MYNRSVLSTLSVTDMRRLEQAYDGLVANAINHYRFDQRDGHTVGQYLCNRELSDAILERSIVNNNFDDRICEQMIIREIEHLIQSQRQPARPYGQPGPAAQYATNSGSMFSSTNFGAPATVPADSSSMLGKLQQTQSQVRQQVAMQPPVAAASAQPAPSKPKVTITVLPESTCPQPVIKEVPIDPKLVSETIGNVNAANVYTIGSVNVGYTNISTDIPVNNANEMLRIFLLNHPELTHLNQWVISVEHPVLVCHKVPMMVGTRYTQSFLTLQQKAATVESMNDFISIMLPAMKNQVQDNGYWAGYTLKVFNDLLTRYFRKHNKISARLQLSSWDELEEILDPTSADMRDFGAIYTNYEAAMNKLILSAVSHVFTNGGVVIPETKNAGLLSTVPALMYRRKGSLFRDYSSMDAETLKVLMSDIADNYLIHTVNTRSVFTNVSYQKFMATSNITVVPYKSISHPIQLMNFHEIDVALSTFNDTVPAHMLSLPLSTIHGYNESKDSITWCTKVGYVPTENDRAIFYF